MDPRQQQPQRPVQRTTLISDFVAPPRPNPNQPPQQYPTNTTPASPAIPQPVIPREPTPGMQPQTPSRPQYSDIRPPVPAQRQNMQAAQMQPTIAGQPLQPGLRPAQPQAQPYPQYQQIPPQQTWQRPEQNSNFTDDESTEPATPNISGSSRSQGFKDALSIVGVLVSALLLAFVLISFVFQSYQVDGPSMQSTLQNNDHLIVWKVPKTIAKFSGGHYIPNRGDVVVFNELSADTADGNKQLIKRIIGLPGERVVVKNDAITVYNEQFPNGFNPDKTLPYGNVITTTPGNADVTLKENQLYVVGDNRTNSLDSRVFGPIDSDQIVGKLVLRVLPLNTMTKF